MDTVAESVLFPVTLEEVGEDESRVPDDDAFFTDVTLRDVDGCFRVVTQRHGQRANET